MYIEQESRAFTLDRIEVLEAAGGSIFRRPFLFSELRYNRRLCSNVPIVDIELLKRAHSPQLATGLASELRNGKLPYGRCEALPSGRTFPAACCG